jgi:hypothetical protein
LLLFHCSTSDKSSRSGWKRKTLGGLFQGLGFAFLTQVNGEEGFSKQRRFRLHASLVAGSAAAGRWHDKNRLHLEATVR